jgi:hypothetical protein
VKLVWIALGAVAALGCGNTAPSTPKMVDSGTAADGAPVAPALYPGEECNANGTSPLVLHFDPATIVVAPGVSRPVTISVEPDLCSPVMMHISVANSSVASAPSQAWLDLRHPSFAFDLTGVAIGKTTLTASLQRPEDTSPTTLQLPIVVQSGAPVTCKKGDLTSGTLNQNTPALDGTASLVGASISTDSAAFTRTDELALPAFPAQIACSADDLTKATSGHPAAPGSLVAIGPAVNFTAGAPLILTQSLRRELDFTIPVNPAAIPPGGRLRHMQVLFMSPPGHELVKTPRAITIASPRIDPQGNGYVAHFSSPWFGTYQVVFPTDAGTEMRTRHLTHRAVIGVSMGSGGAATFGMRHHDQFDAIAPMGGPSDWTWLMWFIRTYDLAGFCPAQDATIACTNPGGCGSTCTSYAPNLYPFHETYAHTEDFDHWFYQTGGGNGGTFGRDEYTQIFDDLGIMLGDPNGQNPDPNLTFFPAGPTSSDVWVTGSGITPSMPSGVDCRVTVDPISTDANYMNEQTWQTECNASRCSNSWKAPTGYYDRLYNPTGSLQVLTFCDGASDGVSPYVDTWPPPGPMALQPGQGTPDDVALAVDLNGNGQRDFGEPVLSQGAEPWNDTGTDGLFDQDEPGYDPVTNPDPNQDDYDFQLNPNGTENNHRYDVGEPFFDYGLDGVPGTLQQAHGGYDYGEGDGKFTMSNGVVNFYAVDPHSILHQWSTNLPGGPMTDSELLRFDVWSDGGVRDLFNFAAVANHLQGAISSRLKSDGTQLRSTAFYNGFDKLPGQVVGDEAAFNAYNMTWADLVDDPGVRYGTVDATPAMIAAGDGQHVGTPAQLLDRITATLFFAAQHWPDADRTLTELTSADPETTTKNVLGTACEISPAGQCITNFTGPVTGRTGPIIIQLPPGYGLAENQKRDVRYPVVFVLHGYGQTPQDLEAVAVVSTNFMDDASKSAATRLAKFILVYVDGRCRVGADGYPECIEGTFWLNSTRPHGALMDSWFDEVVAYIDQNYRTMGPSDVDWVE